MIVDRASRAFTAHRDALQEILERGVTADAGFILNCLTSINHWGDRDQRADLTSEILDAFEAGKLDDTALRSLNLTIEYLTVEALTCPRQVIVEVRDNVPVRRRCDRIVASDSPSFYCTRHANG